MTQLKYETWPHLTPKVEDAARFDRAIAAENQQRRPNHKAIEAWNRDKLIALSLADQ